jgi:hypothetical protein
MTTATAEAAVGRPRDWRAILLGGLAAGVGDICYAFVASGMRGVGPVRVLQSVASGLMGRLAFEGGAPTAALGLVLHFFIATSAAAVYFLASRWLDVLVRRAVLFGLLYGVVVFLVMHFVVLPLSAIPFKVSNEPLAVVPHVLGHMLLVGLPIGLAVRWGAR